METELLVVFTDKDFKYNWAREWDVSALQKRASIEPKLIKRFWEEEKLRAYAEIAQHYPQNWKKFSDFQKAHKKWFFDGMRKQKEAQDKGKVLSEKEWQKGMPIFKSKIKPKDIRVIFTAKNCKTNLLRFEDATYKKWELILKPYKNENTISG